MMAGNPHSFLKRSKNLNCTHYWVRKLVNFLVHLSKVLKSCYQHKVLCDPILIDEYSSIDIHMFQLGYSSVKELNKC